MKQASASKHWDSARELVGSEPPTSDDVPTTLSGDPDEKDDAKATAARRWTTAVNAQGGFGSWDHIICYDANELESQLSNSIGKQRGQ